MAKKKNTAKAEQREPRDPVVAIMGHIDHGKSTLLDFIRKTNVVAEEAGGITQHISAYEAHHQNRTITFLDTPGHEAFAKMRSRGAAIADIAILVVSAEDGVKEQTKSAHEFITQSGIPFVVAITKIDTPQAHVQASINSMIESGIYLESFGGEIPYTPVSAKTGEGVSDLLDTVVLSADLEELTGDRQALASGYVLESSLDSTRGIRATLIIKNGTVTKGQYILAGTAGSPVRLMEDFMGTPISSASFSQAVQVIGFNTLPEAGSDFSVFTSKKEASVFVKELEDLDGGGEKEITDSHTEGKLAIPLVIKADVQGSVDAIKYQIAQIKSPTAYYKILLEGVGEISEDDVKRAGADSEAVFVGFQVGLSSLARDYLERFNMTAQSFTIIYELTEYLEKILEERRPRLTVEKITGTARIIRIFSWSNKGGVIGGRVQEGSLKVKDKVKIIRRGNQVGTAVITELQKGKQPTDAVGSEDEFGMQIETRFDIAEGDELQGFIVTQE